MSALGAAYYDSTADVVADEGLYVVGTFGESFCLEDFTPPPGPVIGSVSPIEGTTIGRTQVITFTVSTTSPLRRVIISAIRGGEFIEEMVHDGISFAASYLGGSNSRVNTAGGGFTYNILRLGGWRGTSVTLRITAIDAFGQIAQKTVGEPQCLYTWPVAYG